MDFLRSDIITNSPLVSWTFPVIRIWWVCCSFTTAFFLQIPCFVILSFVPSLLRLQKWRRSLTALIEALEPTYYIEFPYIQGSMTSGGSVPESLNSSNQATPVKIIPPTPHRKLRAKSQGGKQWYFVITLSVSYLISQFMEQQYFGRFNSKTENQKLLSSFSS